MEQQLEKAVSQYKGFVCGANNLKHFWIGLQSKVPREIEEVDIIDWQILVLPPRVSLH